MHRLLTGIVLFAALEPGSFAAGKDRFPGPIAAGVTQLAEMPEDDFKECSGLVVSRRHPGILWTHNDGQDRRLFAIDRDGRKLAEFELQGVFLFDFEDLAIDDRHRLYFADIGNNLEVRPSLLVHRVAEPDPKSRERVLSAETSWLLTFPQKSFDAEALFVWGDFGYLISKTTKDKKARLYRWPLNRTGAQIVLEELGALEVHSPVTGADLSPDGRKLGLVATDGAYVIEVDGPIEDATKRTPWHTRLKPGQIEGCAFDRDGLLAIAESRELLLFHGPAFRPDQPTPESQAP